MTGHLHQWSLQCPHPPFALPLSNSSVTDTVVVLVTYSTEHLPQAHYLTVEAKSYARPIEITRHTAEPVPTLQYLFVL